ncbi:MAG TPA: hypothetical protein VD997_00075 [Phycisphaerales bacterium]|nr:hypothetical protein [Phycisphaerales bacterium]
MDDGAFLRAFRAQQIPAVEWTHRAHVWAAYLMLLEMPLGDAVAAMREGIKKLNAAHGLVETPERGYHETLTRAWVTVIDSTVRSRGRAESFEAFAAEHPHLLCVRRCGCSIRRRGCRRGRGMSGWSLTWRRCRGELRFG